MPLDKRWVQARVVAIPNENHPRSNASNGIAWLLGDVCGEDEGSYYGTSLFVLFESLLKFSCPRVRFARVAMREASAGSLLAPTFIALNLDHCASDGPVLESSG